MIHTDRGTVFESSLMKCLCQTFSILKTRTCPYHPQSDGLVERIFRTIKPLLSAVAFERRISWVNAIPYVELGMRCSNQASTKFSPFEILFGNKMFQNSNHPIKTQVERLKHKTGVTRETYQNLQQAAKQQAARFNTHIYNKKIKVGDKVLIKDHFSKFPNK